MDLSTKLRELLGKKFNNSNLYLHLRVHVYFERMQIQLKYHCEANLTLVHKYVN